MNHWRYFLVLVSCLLVFDNTSGRAEPPITWSHFRGMDVRGTLVSSLVFSQYYFFRESLERTITWLSRAVDRALLTRSESDSRRRKEIKQALESGSENPVRTRSSAELQFRCWRSGNRRDINRRQTWWDRTKFIFTRPIRKSVFIGSTRKRFF